MSTQTTLILVTCGKRADVAATAVAMFERFWAGCPFDRVVASDCDAFRPQGWGMVATPPNAPRDWSSVLIAALQACKSERVVVWLDDYLLTTPVREEKTAQLVKDAGRLKASCLRLVSFPVGTGKIAREPNHFEHKPRDPYRMSLHAAIWKRDDLLALLVPGESPWQFEENALERAIKAGLKVIVPKIPYVEYLDGTLEGRWRQTALEHLGNYNVRPDEAYRPSTALSRG